MAFLLDTNVCIQYLRGRNALVLQRFKAHPSADIHLCAVVIGELYLGAEKSAHRLTHRAQIDGFVRPYKSFPFDDAAAHAYARIRADLESKGTPIGPLDTMIAAIAVVHGLTLVTHNTREFGRVVGLAIEDWEIP